MICCQATPIVLGKSAGLSTYFLSPPHLCTALPCGSLIALLRGIPVRTVVHVLVGWTCTAQLRVYFPGRRDHGCSYRCLKKGAQAQRDMSKRCNELNLLGFSFQLLVFTSCIPHLLPRFSNHRRGIAIQRIWHDPPPRCPPFQEQPRRDQCPPPRGCRGCKILWRQR